jgi:hypothetical protein
MAQNIVDLINAPAHYTSSDTGIQCIEITERMDFLMGNALKYVWRAGLKSTSSERQDLEKAAWYVRRAIKNAYGIRKEPLRCNALSKYLDTERDRARRGLVIMLTSGNPAIWETALYQIEKRVQELSV